MTDRWTGPVMVTLVDGEMCWSDAEAWRHETEARMLMRYPPLARADLLAAISHQRGVGAVEDLRATMAKLEEKGA